MISVILIQKIWFVNFYMVSSCSILFTDFRTVFVFARQHCRLPILQIIVRRASLSSFCSWMIFYAVCNFLRWKGKFTRGRLEVAEKPLLIGQTLILRVFFGFSVRAPEVPSTRCKNSVINAENAILCSLKKALPVPERKKKHFSIEMCSQNLHSTPQNQRLATRKWFFGHFKSSPC